MVGSPGHCQSTVTDLTLCEPYNTCLGPAICIRTKSMAVFQRLEHPDQRQKQASYCRPCRARFLHVPHLSIQYCIKFRRIMCHSVESSDDTFRMDSNFDADNALPTPVLCLGSLQLARGLPHSLCHIILQSEAIKFCPTLGHSAQATGWANTCCLPLDIGATR